MNNEVDKEIERRLNKIKFENNLISVQAQISLMKRMRTKLFEELKHLTETEKYLKFHLKANE